MSSFNSYREFLDRLPPEIRLDAEPLLAALQRAWLEDAKAFVNMAANQKWEEQLAALLSRMSKEEFSAWTARQALATEALADRKEEILARQQRAVETAWAMLFNVLKLV